MKEINCLGESCPIPVLKIKQTLKTMGPGDCAKVITDHSCVLQSVLSHFKKTGVTIEHEEVMNGIWEIFITKH
ncbi:MAG: sulfurtransferase TusA family protein [Firmicutes bacterium]|nr:sulfurtransferase TusA family protein [Bacillota bacterium]